MSKEILAIILKERKRNFAYLLLFFEEQFNKSPILQKFSLEKLIMALPKLQNAMLEKFHVTGRF